MRFNFMTDGFHFRIMEVGRIKLTSDTTWTWSKLFWRMRYSKVIGQVWEGFPLRVIFLSISESSNEIAVMKNHRKSPVFHPLILGMILGQSEGTHRIARLSKILHEAILLRESSNHNFLWCKWWILPKSGREARRSFFTLSFIGIWMFKVRGGVTGLVSLDMRQCLHDTRAFSFDLY